MSDYSKLKDVGIDLDFPQDEFSIAENPATEFLCGTLSPTPDGLLVEAVFPVRLGAAEIRVLLTDEQAASALQSHLRGERVAVRSSLPKVELVGRHSYD